MGADARPDVPEQRTSRAEWLALAALLAASFVARLAAIVVVVGGLTREPPPGTDEYEYDVYAWNLAQGRGYRGPSPDVADPDHLTAYRPPVAPLYYAAVYRLFGHHHVAAHVVDSLVATATVLLVFFITRRLFGRRAAWVAAVLYAFYPVAIYYNLYLLSESLAAALVCLFAWLCLPITGRRGAPWAAGAGLALGLLLLCKPGFVFLLPLLPAWAWLVCGRDRRLWLRAALIPAVAGLLILPWAVRNQQTFGRFIPFSTGGGSLLLQANNRIVVGDPLYHGYAVWDKCLPEYAAELEAAGDEIERDAVAKRHAVAWLRANPDKWFYLARGKVWRLWTPDYFGRSHRELRPVVSLYYGLILICFLAAVVPVTARLLRERHPGLILPALIVATMLMAVVFHGQHRYRFPVDSLCVSIAAAGLAWLAGVVGGGGFAALWAAARGGAARHRLGLAAAALLAVAFGVAWRLDEGHIAAYRRGVCAERLETIRGAVADYQGEHGGRPPERLEELVPAYLPTVEALHCPLHSLEYHDYLLLGSRDADRASRVISYRIEPPAGPGGAVRIAETYPGH